tara:strand:+ start:286 stop:399 length:114 start_codon:yes stop_codon:yes gene_type:complete
MGGWDTGVSTTVDDDDVATTGIGEETRTSDIGDLDLS